MERHSTHTLRLLHRLQPSIVAEHCSSSARGQGKDGRGGRSSAASDGSLRQPGQDGRRCNRPEAGGRTERQGAPCGTCWWRRQTSILPRRRRSCRGCRRTGRSFRSRTAQGQGVRTMVRGGGWACGRTRWRQSAAAPPMHTTAAVARTRWQPPQARPQPGRQRRQGLSPPSGWHSWHPGLVHHLVVGGGRPGGRVKGEEQSSRGWHDRPRQARAATAPARPGAPPAAPAQRQAVDVLKGGHGEQARLQPLQRGAPGALLEVGAAVLAPPQHGCRAKGG